MKIDPVTKRWIRNAADERAAHNGCRFDEERGQFVVDWMEEFLCLYEGEFAGQPMILRDWALDCTLRGFGWIRHSERWGRSIRRFTKFCIFKPKKNKKSPTMAGWGLYLLCADGEMGQKVFAGSKDGKQSRENVFMHACEMAKASPALLEECDVGPAQILHVPTKSVFRVLTGADSASQKSKEGINGSILIDETHVVDRAFISRISRAGISRSEPLLIEVSTAGDDPESYGRETYDHGKAVNAGEREDQALLFDVHEAPQDLSNEQLAKNPAEFGRMANPAWGHTVNEEEFLADYARSQVSLRELADFKMYRLNIWKSSSNPAIRPEDWAACYEDFDLAQLDGRRCYGALDLGFKWDTSAVTLLFPWTYDDELDDAHPTQPDDEPKPHFRLLTFFWLPEFAADLEQKEIRWRDWEERGDVTITEGNSADFPLIRRSIVELSKRYKLVQLNYDERFAQVLAQELQDDFGLNVQNFAQTAPNLNAPCRGFEQAIIDRRLHHRGNHVMNWQVGNLTFKDRARLLMPAKPDKNKLARIDGPVSAIMALDPALKKTDDDDDWYEKGCLRD